MSGNQLRSDEFARLKSGFQAKLSEFCRERGSIAKICADCKINRQQFNKYLSGQSLPSMYTLHTIARSLGVDISEFFLPPEQSPRLPRDPTELLRSVLPPTASILTPGYYREYTEASEVPGTLIRSLCRIWDDGTFLRYKRKMPVLSRYRSRSRMWTYDGFAFESTNSTFIHYVNSTLNENFGAYLLRPGSISGKHLIDLKLAVSGLLTYEPCSTVTYFEYIGESPGLMGEMRACGVHAPDKQTKSDREICAILNEMSDARGTLLMTRR